MTENVSNLEGSITIQTQELTKAIKSFDQFAKSITQSVKTIEGSLSRVEKSLENMSSGYKKVGDTAKTTAEKEAAAARKTAELLDRKSNAVEKASQRVMNMEQKIKKSNVSQAQQERLLNKTRSALDNYSTKVNDGSMKAVEMDNANTKLASSLGQVTRSLKVATKSGGDSARQQVANTKALSAIEISYDRVRNSVTQSVMADKDKARAIKDLNSSMNRAKQSLIQYGTGTKQAAAAQAHFRSTAAKAGIEVRNLNAEARKKELSGWKNQMRDLSSSVQLALGPLSGVASRISALTALFSRNAFAIAGLLAGFTGLTVGFAKSVTAATLAQTTFLQLEGIVSGLGERAKFTAQELYDMGTDVGLAFLTSAEEGRKAAGSLATFGNIGKEQFRTVLDSAQGLSQVMGGTLQSNVIRLGRLLEDPADNFDSLRRAGITFSDSVKSQVDDLQALGRTTEANNLILSKFSHLQEAAANSATGLAGVVDTAGEQFKLFFENAFDASGATEEATKQVEKFNSTFKELAEGEFANVIGTIYVNAVKALGTTLNIIAGNLDKLGIMVILIAAVSLPKLIMTMGRFAASLLPSISGVNRLIASLKVYDIQTKKAVVGTQALGRVMKTVPFFQVVAGIAAIVAMFVAMRKSSDETATGVVEDLGKIQAKINGMQNISQGQKEGFLGNIQELESRKKRLEALTEEAIELRKEYYAFVGKGAINRDGSIGLVETEEEIKRIKELISLRSEAKSVSELTKEIRNLEDSMRSAYNRAEALESIISETGVNVDELKDRTKKLRGEFMSDEVALEKLRKRYGQVKESLEELRKVEALAEKEGASEGIKKAAEEARKDRLAREELLPIIRKEIEAKEDSMETNEKLSRSYGSLLKTYNNASRELETLSKVMRGMNESDIKGEMEIQKKLESFGLVMSKLKDGELPAFAKAVGVNIEGMTNEEAIIKKVTAAYEELISKHRQMDSEKTGNDNALGFLMDTEAGLKGQIARMNAHFDAEVNAVRNSHPELKEAVEKRVGILKRGQEDIIKMQERHFLEDITASNPMSQVEQIDRDFELRAAALMEHYNFEEEQYKDHLDKMQEDAEKSKAFVTMSNQAQGAADVMSGAMSAMQSMGKEQTKDYKRMALTQATIAQGLAVAQSWDDPEIPTWAKLGQAGMVAANVGASIKQINSASYADGGFVSGKGTATSDSIPAWLSNGEFVMKAAAVRSIGINNLKAMNEGRTSSFSSGGPVEPISLMNSGGGSSSNTTTVNVYNYSSDTEVEERETVDSKGNKQTDIHIRDVVRQSISRGEMDGVMGSNFGVSRKGRGR